MENRPDFYTAAGSEPSHSFLEAVGPGKGDHHHQPAENPESRGRCARGKTGGGIRHPLILCILAAIVLLGTAAGCSDSDSDDLVLTDAIWVAFQDGEGAWQEIEVPQDMVFDAEENVTDPEGRYSLAIVSAMAAQDAEDNGFVQTSILKTTTAEIPEIDFSGGIDSEDTSLEVTVDQASLDAGSVYLYARGDDSSVWNSDPLTLYPTTAPYDLAATLHSAGQDYPSKIFVESFDATALGQASTLDVVFGDFVDLSAPYTFTFAPSADEILDDAEVYLMTANVSLASLGEEGIDETNEVQYTAPVDLNAVAPGSSYMLDLSIDLDDDSSVSYYEGFAAPDDYSVSGGDIPYTFDGQYVADRSTGSLLPGVSWTEVDAGGNAIAYTSIFNGEANSIDYAVTTVVTAGRVGAGETGFTIPDLSSAQGWYPLWSIPSDVQERGGSSSAVLSSDLMADLFMPNLTMLYFDGYPRLADRSWIAIIMNSWQTESDPL